MKDQEDNDARLTELKNWLKDREIEYQSIQPASADASFRRYFRIDQVTVPRGDHAGNYDSLVMMDAPPAKEDCTPFIHVDELLLEAGINVPLTLVKIG